MYCTYCGTEINKGRCEKCNLLFSRVKVFSLKAERPMEPQRRYYCVCCGSTDLVLRKAENELSGICNKCRKPYRLDQGKDGDTLFL